ncbi:MAG: type II toxin-antitoxin system Phd/YefM family antitoxin [Lentisphaerae bacterium]|mgnify:FL=1|nr:type II toxin-antitoxin system Phd/YefM family antitoxin [Lentisphaerota bacterium]MBT4816635.1 type II toxin-antitoxin system Phd/YefM family antitoxin [Lentisphaerota bacterium]MBT5606398.1 type II toxin-antitoxin system Phd/YefM family antitoxin [Lentisphaerota bacterium]MBT7059750.1 type II toxin-antitoxin system Phd/YefM family antitoxin [Lentisphaerota bacterium]MBT7847870.1 type II toxin-antitoxin system Phd/YefM family antitoxin [Lentisphaerota bacterium]
MPAEAIGVFYAKTHLSAILEEVQAGKRFTVTKHGKAVANIVPVTEPRPVARRGSAASSDFFMSSDFDEPLDDFSEYM